MLDNVTNHIKELASICGLRPRQDSLGSIVEVYDEAGVFWFTLSWNAISHGFHATPSNKVLSAKSWAVSLPGWTKFFTALKSFEETLDWRGIEEEMYGGQEET